MDKRFPIEDQITMLASSLRGRVITARDSDYDLLRTVVLGQFDCRPAAVIRVANAADVAAVINFARATDLPLAVRSGGHSAAGFSGTDGGLVIDLRDLNRIDFDATMSSAWVGTGLTAGEVTKEMEAHGLIIPFGDAATVGIGGLTLGGGIGFLARKHGLTIDSLLAVEIVTANGDILVADAEHHADLFWAVRGGGGNFGVATRLKFRLHALPAFIGGPLILPATADVLAGFAALAETAPDELTTIANVMPAPPLPFIPPHLHGKLVLMGMMAFVGNAEAAARVLAPFRALATPIADLVGPAPLSSLYMPEDPTMRPAVTMRSLFIENFGLDDARLLLEHLERIEAPMKIGQFRILGGASGRVAPEATAYAHRKSRIMVTYLAMYGGPTAPFERWAEECTAEMRQHDTGVYSNFLAAEGPERLRAAYPGKTWDRLRAIKLQYDPENLFRLNQNIPPAT